MSRFVRRKWGWYYVILNYKHFKVKLLRFQQGKSLSLQYHKLRNELWLFLSGVGSFKKGTRFKVIGAGEYVLVEKEIEHKYYSTLPTWVLEIQYGDKCAEEDIVRI